VQPRSLARCRTASLATADPQGLPHAANVQYAHDHAWRLVFVSGADTPHARHLQHKPDAAITIYAHHDEPANIHGLQLHARAESLTPGSSPYHAALECYLARYPFIAESEQFLKMVRSQTLFRLTPSWLRWIDNRRRFGFKIEKTFEPSTRPS